MRTYSLLLIALLVGRGEIFADDAPPRPNVVWITSEDHGPHMGCYGDSFATTPHVDALAARGVVYLHTSSNAPVCAPARTTLISGLYGPSTGGEHMRSMLPYPRGKKMYPQFLREAGYYCTNNSKEDYNLAKPGQVWDDSSPRAHWRNRAAGQPFFAVFNSTKSHESQLRTRPHRQVHDPAQVRLPAYHPDTPETRQDWAQYYDKVTEADADAGKVLQQLDEDGLAKNTIVFYFGDHGSGMPRSKRWPYNSGLHVPLVVHLPEKFRHLAPADYRPGGTSDRLVSFVDFAPTLLSLVGIEPPAWMQGSAFLGAYIAPPRQYNFGFRGRMDERYDLVRSVTDERYVYVRNYMPHKIQGQYLDYMFQTPTTRVWKQLHDEGKLNPSQDAFWNVKSPEELYDLENDPDEVHNLAGSADHRAILARLRQAHREHVLEIRDVGFLPEGDMHRRSAGRSPYDMARGGDAYPLERIFAMADMASMLHGEDLPQLIEAMEDVDSAVRYWAVLGVLMCGEDAISRAGDELRQAINDASPDVRVVAAQALLAHGEPTNQDAALGVLAEAANAEQHGVFAAMVALGAIDDLGPRASSLHSLLDALPRQPKTPHGRYDSYVPRLLERLLDEDNASR